MRWWGNKAIKIHSYANLLPMMNPDEEYAALKADKKGLQFSKISTLPYDNCSVKGRESMTPETDRIWTEGRCAALAGVSLEQNPYRYDRLILRIAWEKGFKRQPLSAYEKIHKFYYDSGFGEDYDR